MIIRYYIPLHCTRYFYDLSTVFVIFTPRALYSLIRPEHYFLVTPRTLFVTTSKRCIYYYFIELFSIQYYLFLRPQHCIGYYFQNTVFITTSQTLYSLFPKHYIRYYVPNTVFVTRSQILYSLIRPKHCIRYKF